MDNAIELNRTVPSFGRNKRGVTSVLRAILCCVTWLCCSFVNSAEVLWSGESPIDLSLAMEYAVSDDVKLSGNEVWHKDWRKLQRHPEQYLHFRFDVFNQEKRDRTLWFVIAFPAIKHLQVSDGLTIWNTGDDLPFDTRPVASPDYIFPVYLKAQSTTTISGSMHGEILRYIFSLTTPEHANSEYRQNIVRDMLFFGAMATLVVMCLIIYFATRYITYFSFALFSFALGAWFFRVFGYGFEFIWPDYPQINDVTYGVLIYLVMASSSWMVVSILQRQDRQVHLQKVLFYYTALLIVAGAVSFFVFDLDTTLRLPLYWFFPALILMLVITIMEHRSGSQKARWFAYAMMPMTLGSAVVVLSGLGVGVALDIVMSMMLGIVATCLFLAVMISTYLIKLLQSQRDMEKSQTERLEQLVKQRTQALEDSNVKLQKLASCDPLTDLPNRRSLDLFVDAISEQDGGVMGIAMLDLDHFKQLNDTFGHDVGDIVLKAVAQLLQPLNQDSRIAGRFGGEEFAIIESQPSKTEFAQLLALLHSQINEIEVDGYPKIRVKACIGWVISGEQESISDSFRRADKALYRAKENGRNQLVTSSLTEA